MMVKLTTQLLQVFSTKLGESKLPEKPNAGHIRQINTDIYVYLPKCLMPLFISTDFHSE